MTTWINPEEYRYIQFGEVVSGSIIKFGSGYKFGDQIYEGTTSPAWSEA